MTTTTSGAREQKNRVRVVIADDSVLLREGIALLLVESGFDVVAQAGDGEDLLRKVGAHKPDVAVVDVRMPPTHTDEGLRAAHRIRAEHPGTAVLVLSQYVEEAYALDLLSESTESCGYLLKDRVADVATFTDAVRRVAEKHVTAIFSKLDLPLAVDDHRRVLAVLVFLRSDESN